MKQDVRGTVTQRTAIADYACENGIAGVVRDQPHDARVTSLDGLRGIAILLVLIHNAGGVNGALDGIPLKVWTLVSNAGWVGVQLFFALSGFLITRILLAAKGKQGWLKSFYARRALRIVPLYYVFLAALFFIVPHVVALKPLLENGTASRVWYWTYLSNWSAPFGGQPEALPHVWSLAVEEQFYLIWPLAIACLGDRMLARTSLVVVLTALGARIALHAVLPEEVASAAAYSWTVARADTIVLGGLVALSLRHASIATWGRDRIQTALWISLGLCLLATAVQRGFPSTGLSGVIINQPLSGVLSALLVFVCACGPLHPGGGAHTQAALQRWLSKPWLVAIGKYSYAIYVLHRPIHVLLRGPLGGLLTQGDGNVRFAGYILYTFVVFLASFSCAVVTWVIIEQPFLSLKHRFPMPSAP